MNYSNLSDIEFESLCKDVLSKELAVKLERFGAGRDGGIDLTDDAYKKNIIVQVKHYTKTDVDGLIRSLKNEVAKVKSLQPKQYYVCCSKGLTPQSKQRIYELFADYMTSTKNIITTIELDNFLEAPENTDILRKHFKLWLDSTNILTDILSNDVFIDSEVLLSGIQEEVKLFVKTSAFDIAVSCLEKNNVLIIVGDPGVGKTVTSKMLVLNFASLGYRVRYTSDGSDLAALKRSLSQSPEAKEVILLDDCFGQAYFNMKETQENELLALIKYVNMNSSKLLIMNSRITIYQEAKERTANLVRSLERKEYRAYILNMENMSVEEKAKIFYNHLYFCEIPSIYFEDIRRNKNYRKIVKHRNYNPRIIEFVCTSHQYKCIDPYSYAGFIMHCLDEPEQIWKNEYERRLAESDRLLLSTLFSLTDTAEPFDIVKQCYEYRVSKTIEIDSSVNHFEQSLNRLTNSMVRILDVKGTKMLCVSNPSVNDFLRIHLSNNYPELQALLDTAICVRQLKRLLDNVTYKARMLAAFQDHSILAFVFENDKQKACFIACYCAVNGIEDLIYRSCVHEYIRNIHEVDMYESEKASISTVLERLLGKEQCLFYELDKVFRDPIGLFKILESQSLPEQVEIVKRIDWLFTESERREYIKVARQALHEGASDFCCDVPAETYDISISDIIEDFRYEDESGGHIDGDAAADAVKEMLKDIVSDELSSILSELPSDIDPEKTFFNDISISIDGGDSVVESYLRDDYAFDAYREDKYFDDIVIDNIFERDR